MHLPLKSNLFLIFTVFLFLINCTTYQPERYKDPLQLGNKLFKNSDTILCKKGSLPFGNKRILNNQWGAFKVKKGEFTICLAQKIINKDTLVGWQWNMPKKSYGVVAYPEIHFGKGPWSKDPKITPLTALSSLKEFNIFYDAIIVSDDNKFNLSADIWLGNSIKNTQNHIDTELMIWEDYNKFTPNGKFKEEIHTSAGIYKLYIGKVKRKKMGLQWNYVALVRKEKRTKGKIPMLEILNFLQQKQYIKIGLYITSIEFGTELSNSNGYIIFKDYTIDLQY